MKNTIVQLDSTFLEAVELEESEIQKLKRETSSNVLIEKDMLDNNWVLYLINKTSISFTHISTEKTNGTWTNWLKFNHPVGRTCNSTDCQECFNNNNYTPILNTGCQSANFGYRLLFQKDGGLFYIQGTARPDCKYRGGVDCFGS